MSNNNVDMDVWITQQAMAALHGVKVQAVHNWIKRGKINSKKIEGSRLVLVDKNSYQPTSHKN